MTDNQIVINNLSKVYDNGFNALKNINLSIKKGEIFAMLGPNGAGKTTLISIICGIVNPTSGEVKVDNFDIINEIEKELKEVAHYEDLIDAMNKYFPDEKEKLEG